jgi:hypothetical protein
VTLNSRLDPTKSSWMKVSHFSHVTILDIILHGIGIIVRRYSNQRFSNFFLSNITTRVHYGLVRRITND